MKDEKRQNERIWKKQQNRILGQLGENLAAGCLEADGYEILERNYRCPYGEIDLVARKDGYLVFVEVKTRRSRAFGEPAEAVSRSKQKKIRLTAATYLAGYEEPCRGSEFQVMEIQVNHLRGLSFHGVTGC